MDDALAPQGGFAPPHAASQPRSHAIARHARGLAKRFCTNNPFYLISAWLVFSGLRISFDTGGETFETWALIGGLAGYALLAAVAACVLIRLGRVWEDIRTLVLLVLLMFLAIAVSLDEALVIDARRGSLFLIGGLTFAVVLSECLIVALRVRLPLGYRIPFHLLLALFFAYPIVLAPLVSQPSGVGLRWGLFGFSTVAAAIFLTLLPAIRRGADYLRDSGTPWSWPWYPLTLFFILAVAVALRAYYLCLSLHFVGSAWTIFGGYFLVPLLIALNILWLEIGLVTRRKTTMRWALAAPVAWVALAQAGRQTDVVYTGFLSLFMESLHASPLYLALLAAMVFYGVAALRRAPSAAEGWWLAIAALTVITPQTLTLRGPYHLTAWPLLLGGAVLAWQALRERASLRAALSAAAWVVAALIDSHTSGWMLSYGELLPLELGAVALLAIGAVFRDEEIATVRAAAAVLMVAAAVSAATGKFAWPLEPAWLFAGLHALTWAVVAWAYGRWLGLRYYYQVAAVIVCIWLFAASAQLYTWLRPFVAGLDRLVCGLAFFFAAVMVSVLKARRAGNGWLAKKPSPERA
ncbi:MAG TPA: hypothetical protein VFW87_25345 [Pirellulales bacterium]|nr:hypothetical protein [Pirellulales bacterium]